MKRIKVMHVLTDSNIGGAGMLLCNMLATADAERFDYTVVLPEGSRLIPRLEALPCRVRTVAHGKDRSYDVRAIREYARLIRQIRPVILHTHAAISARIAGKLCGVPVMIQSRHCVFPLKSWQKTGAFRFFYRTGNRILSDRVIAVAEAARENLLALGMDGRQIHVIVNGVLPVRDCDEAELDAARARWGIDQSHFVVGMAARLEIYKGQETLLRAAARCLRTATDFRFLFVGDGSERARYEALAASLGISDFVVFTGFVEDMAPVWNLLQVNVNASFGTETASLSLSEGMSRGVPMVASAYGGNPAMVTEGENGLLFPPRDDEALAAALMRLHDDETLRRQLSLGARRRFEERMTAEKMTAKLERLYRDALREKIGKAGKSRRK